MHNSISSTLQAIGAGIDVVGVLVIILGFILATIVLLQRFLQRHSHNELYRSYRQNLAKSTLIGLEFLVAGDIIRTVAGDLTPMGVLTLGGIVLIRIVLGMSLEAEIRDRPTSWWKKRRKP